MSVLSQLLPPRIKNSVKVLLGRSVAVPASPESSERFSCPVCNSNGVELEPVPFSIFRELEKHEHVYSSFQYETCNLQHYSCSRCSASDRDRLYALYFREALSGRTERLSILDIAPSGALTRFLRGYQQVRIRTADLYQSGVDDNIDITDMRAYTDGQFDAFICSHVLEHIRDDIAAMKELYRVIRKGGWGIAMVPIHLGLQTLHEDFSITDEAGRWKYFGQGDHVRLYSKRAFVERLESVGFSVEQLDRFHFGESVFARYGIHPRSVLYVVKK
jgi:predicted SAM-dependent methyltransferase